MEEKHVVRPDWKERSTGMYLSITFQNIRVSAVALSLRKTEFFTLKLVLILLSGPTDAGNYDWQGLRG